MKKLLVFLIVSILAWLTLANRVLAGGCCFTLLQVSKTGIAGVAPVTVSSILYNSEYNPTTNPVKYRAGETVEVKMVDPKPSQRCQTPVVTDANGHLSTNCYADTSEAMTIYFMTTQARLNGQLIKSNQTTFYFANQDGSWPTIVPIPTTPPPAPTATSKPVVKEQIKTETKTSEANQDQDQDQEQAEDQDQNQVADLEAKVKELEMAVEQQQQKIGFLEGIVQRISNLLKKFFRI